MHIYWNLVSHYYTWNYEKVLKGGKKFDKVIYRKTAGYRFCKYRVSQEERSILWEVIVSVILSKNVCMNMCPIPNCFWDRAIWITTAKLLIRKRYYMYILFLTPVFIVQVAELVQFIINVRKFHCQDQCTLQLVWRRGVLFIWVRLDIPLCRQ